MAMGNGAGQAADEGDEEALAVCLEQQHGLRITLCPTKGRCLTALRPFRRGDQIFHQAPYVATLDSNSLSSRCDRCYRPAASHCPLLRCSACKTVFYCSPSCQRTEWGHHKVECAILVRVFKEQQRSPTSTLRLVLRLLIKRRLQADKVLLQTAVDNYQVCKALPTHMSDTSEDRLVMYAQMARIVQQMVAPDEVDMKEVTQTICRFACNAHTICDEEVRPLGTGLYPVVSIINHSCLPNAVLHFDGSHAAVRALEDIQEGTEPVQLPGGRLSRSNIILIVTVSAAAKWVHVQAQGRMRFLKDISVFAQIAMGP